MLPLIFSSLSDLEQNSFFTSLYQKFYPLMKYRAFKLTNDMGMVDDVVQDTFIRLLCRYNRLRELDETRLAGYIALTVRSAANDALRQKYKNTEKSSSFDLEQFVAAPENHSPELVFIKGEEVNNRICALNRLADEHRELLINKYLLELTNSELAAQYGTTQTNIRQMLSRIRRKLCSILDEMEEL